MTRRRRLGAAGWAIAGALVGGANERVEAQSFGQPITTPSARSGLPATSPAAMGGTAANGFTNSYANPFINPMMNPYLNPYMTQGLVNRNDSLLYFMAAQQAWGGLGSSVAPGGSNAAPMAAEVNPGTGAAPGRALRMGRGRMAPSRPVPNHHVSGRFDHNPAYNDRRGRLANRYAAYGSVPVNAETGAPATAGRTPAPNVNASRYFNRYPSNNANNGR